MFAPLFRKFFNTEAEDLISWLNIKQLFGAGEGGNLIEKVTFWGRLI